MNGEKGRMKRKAEKEGVGNGVKGGRMRGEQRKEEGGMGNGIMKKGE